MTCRCLFDSCWHWLLITIEVIIIILIAIITTIIELIVILFGEKTQINAITVIICAHIEWHFQGNFFLSRKIRTLYYCRFHLPGKNISNNCNFDNKNNRKNNNNTNNNNNSSNSTDNDDDNERPMIVTIIIQPYYLKIFQIFQQVSDEVRARLATGVVFLYVRGSPEGSPPCRGRRAWVPWRPLKLCQRELRLLVGPPKPDRLKARGPTKRDPSVLQVRGLGTGITTLSRKTPMLRKRQKKSRPTCHTA